MDIAKLMQCEKCGRCMVEKTMLNEFELTGNYTIEITESSVPHVEISLFCNSCNSSFDYSLNFFDMYFQDVDTR